MIGMRRSWSYHAMAEGRFPVPLRLGQRAVGWRSSEIEALDRDVQVPRAAQMTWDKTGQRADRGPYVNLAALRCAESLGTSGNSLSRTLLLFPARRADDFGCCWCRQTVLASEIGCSDRAMRKHLGVLILAGLLRKIKRGRNGVQISNMYQLIAWPGRLPISERGHPALRRSVCEDPLVRLIQMRNRHGVPVVAEPDSDRNQSYEKITTTDAGEDALVLERCLLALGPCATECNCRSLRQAPATLLGLLAIG
ncbi:MAG: AlpA family phage regulatory protein [Paracoccus sp. (in: a-proteobacteria)]|nr:AlpA family phage regulatory protein [Paracoccus sp. (in: a-proteobacteria)]